MVSGLIFCESESVSQSAGVASAIILELENLLLKNNTSPGGPEQHLLLNKTTLNTTEIKR